jgi:Concanavalin A-like lectin/glucanases superfamily
MWELICHHTYKCGGLPVDLSDYDSHGYANNVNILPDGVVAESGALQFTQPGSRVRVPVSPAWQPLGGIMVEVTARILTQAAHWQVLIAGDGAFSFFLREHILFAIFTTPPGLSTWPLTGTLADTDGISSAQGLFTPTDFPTFSIPMGEWSRFGFMHNGLDTMELFVNGQLIGRRTMLKAGVPAVGLNGVSIGNAPDNDNQFLDGDIDEIKVWRIDPEAVPRNFLSRPYDQATADCWEQFVRRIRDALTSNPDCADLVGKLESVIDRLRRVILAKGPETRERYVKTCREYARLWRAGKLDSPEMAKLIADWCTWTRLVGIVPGDDPEVISILRSSCLKDVLGKCGSLDCDPQVVALINLIANVCH